jgi:formate hydrogenlyase subunit 6/NADH:ubiquinone oxidoreductase subunit I
LCEESCSTDALELTQDYEIAQFGREGLIFDRARLEAGPEPTVYER